MKTDNVIKLEIGNCAYDTTKIKEILNTQSKITINTYMILVIRITRLIQLDFDPEEISVCNMVYEHSFGHIVYNTDFFSGRWVLSLKLICF